MKLLSRLRIQTVVIIAVLTIVTNTSLFAEKGVFFGTRAGYTMSSSFNIEDIGDKVGLPLTHYFQAGGTISFGISKKFAIQAEFLYNRLQMSGRSNAKDEPNKWKSTIETDNLSIPLGFQFGNKVYFEMGVSLEIPFTGVIKAKWDGNDLWDGGKSKDKFKRKDMKELGLTRFDAMPYIGIGWHSKIGFGISARLCAGIMDLCDKGLEGATIPWNFQAAVTYKFGLKSMSRYH